MLAHWPKLNGVMCRFMIWAKIKLLLTFRWEIEVGLLQAFQLISFLKAPIPNPSAWDICSKQLLRLFYLLKHVLNPTHVFIHLFAPSNDTMGTTGF